MGRGIMGEKIDLQALCKKLEANGEYEAVFAIKRALQPAQKLRRDLEIEPIRYIALVWQTEDVESTAEELNINLTSKEANKVLYNIEKNHNAETGVNWGTIAEYIREYDWERNRK
jgi:hypothetical protein